MPNEIRLTPTHIQPKIRHIGQAISPASHFKRVDTMNHLILTIGNVDAQNFDSVHDIVAHAGYMGSLRVVDDITYSLDLGSDEHRVAAGISQQEVESMIAQIIMFTSATVQSKLVNRYNAITEAAQ